MDILPANTSATVPCKVNLSPIQSQQHLSQPQPQCNMMLIQNPQQMSQSLSWKCEPSSTAKAFLSRNVTPFPKPPQHSQPQCEPLPVINFIPGDKPLHSQGQQQPLFGMKRPQGTQLELSPEDHTGKLGYSSRKRLKEEVINFTRQLAAYSMQNGMLADLTLRQTCNLIPPLWCR